MYPHSHIGLSRRSPFVSEMPNEDSCNRATKWHSNVPSVSPDDVYLYPMGGRKQHQELDWYQNPSLLACAAHLHFFGRVEKRIDDFPLILDTKSSKS